MDSIPPRLWVPLVILYVVSLWLLVSFLLALIGGWLELGRTYKALLKFDGQIFRLQHAYMRFLTSYRAAVSVGASPKGLYLAVFFLFRFCHPPLFIPWQDISVRQSKFLWIRLYEFEFRQAPSVRLRLREKLGKKIQAAAGDAWPGDRAKAGAAF